MYENRGRLGRIEIALLRPIATVAVIDPSGSLAEAAKRGGKRVGGRVGGQEALNILLNVILPI